MTDRKLLIELGIVSIFLTWWWFFVSTNVNPTLGNIYIGLTLSAAVVVLIDHRFGRRQVQLWNQNNSLVTVLVAGLVGYFVLIFGGQLVIRLAEVVKISDLLKLLASSAPAFSKSKPINFLTFAVMVAYIETYALFIAGYDLLASMFNARIDKQGLATIGTWIIIIAISFLFLLLHVTSKGIDNNSALLLVFFMAVISLVLTSIFEDGRPAIILHIIANAVGILSI